MNNIRSKVEKVMTVAVTHDMLHAVRLIGYAENIEPSAGIVNTPLTNIHHLFFWPETAIKDVNNSIDDMCEYWPERRPHLEFLREIAADASARGCAVLILERDDHFVQF